MTTVICFQNWKFSSICSNFALNSGDASNATFEVDVVKSISLLKAQEIKQLLIAEKISISGLFDKSEFLQRLLQHEQTLNAACTTVPLLAFSFVDNNQKYFGLEGVLKDSNLNFLLDTASTCSILTKSTVQRLGLSIVPASLATHSLGGNGRLFNSKTRILALQIANKTVQVDFFVSENTKSLPSNCNGLLGFDFLQQLQSDVMLDFQSRKLKMGSLKNLIPCVHKTQFQRIPFIGNLRMTVGLLFIEIFLDGVRCKALVDVGSLYTIANTAATEAILVAQRKQSLEGKSAAVDVSANDNKSANMSRHSNLPSRLIDLPKSGTVAAGIDGLPHALHLLTLKTFQLGSKTSISLHNTTEAIKSSRGNIGTLPHHGIFAAQIPAFAMLGVQDSVVILGLDVLSQLQIVISKDSMYVRKTEDNT